MQLDSTSQPSSEVSDGLLYTASVIPNSGVPMTEELPRPTLEPTKLYSQYIDSMEMFADVGTVAAYFDDHPAWFRRCAQPMKAEPLGDNGYALVIGRFGSYGFIVEPKIGLHLLPQESGIYRIETIPVPNYEPQGYDVDFRAAMELVELDADEPHIQIEEGSDRPAKITRVQWHLDLTVTVQLPRFVHRALPQSLIQSTGDRLLHQIVRQVSQRLTRKVLEDFHTSQNLPIPRRSNRWFQRRHETETDPS